VGTLGVKGKGVRGASGIRLTPHVSRLTIKPLATSLAPLAPSLTLPHNMGEGWVGDRRTVMNNAG